MTSLLSREQIKTAVKEAADIVQVIGEHVELKRAGTRFTGRCPFHAEKTPSFSVNPQGQFYHCFGCGESGDVFSFVMKINRLDFPEALKLLAQKYHVDLPERQLSEAEQAQLRQRENLYRANEEAAALFQQCLRDEQLGKTARIYLEQRGVPWATIEQYRLGCAPDPSEAGWSYCSDRLAAKGLKPEVLEAAGLAVKKERGGYYDRFRGRVMFPIFDMTGRVVAFGGRVLGDEKPKYMNSPESPVFDKSRLLFGLYQHRENIRKQKQALVVEGNFDLLLLAVHGIANVVAPLGTALTRPHVHSLRNYAGEVVLLFDADAAGLKAAMRSVPLFLAEQVECRVALLPSGHDPDSYVRAEGPDALAALAQAGRPLAEFVYDTLAAQHGLTLAGKSSIVQELKQLVLDSADPGQRALMIAHFSAKLGVSPGYFVQGPVRPAPIAPQVPSSGFQALAKQERQLADFLILYPEYLPELKAAGLQQINLAPATVRLVDLLEQMGSQGPVHPEQLLTAPLDAAERAYVVQLLTGASPFIAGDDDAAVANFCRELQTWLHGVAGQQTGADLQQQICEAERLGNITLLMDLMRRKQELERKRAGY